MTETIRKPQLLFIAVGGTISMVKEPLTGKSVPTLTAAELLARTTIVAHADVRCVDLPEALKQIRRPDDLISLARCLQRETQTPADGVVVAHGTDTLEEVAYCIDEMFSPRVPLIFTGAMRPAWAAEYDGSRNLDNAFRLAMTVSPDYGVLVTLHDEIFEAWSVYKADTAALDGFTARRGAPSGTVRGEHVEMSWRPASRRRFGRVPASLPASVPILTLGVGDDGALLDLVAARSVQGLVVAGMGAGSVPPIAYERMLALAKGGLPIVLCSSAMSGPTAAEYYYPGAYDELLAAGVKVENHLNARKARIRLLLSLGVGESYSPFEETLSRRP
jgi:L-asparaginase